MAKFYVRSGNFQTVVSAADAERAALWVIHHTLRQVVPVYDDGELSPDQKQQATIAQGLMVLGNTIQLSETGFGEGIELDTFELLVQWHQLMVALDRMAALVDGDRATLDARLVVG